MKRDLENLFKKRYDLLVIGGGINGAGIANLAQANGFKAALIEKGDFASGTSSKSTKLIHGGIRYLENLDFGLVRESLVERSIQLKAAPHIVKRLSFIIPVYKGDMRPLWMMKLGVLFYDFLAGKYSIGEHRRLSRENILELVPGIKRDGLLGGILYYDAQMDDARLCLENILSAKAGGADVANYAQAISFIKESEKVVGVRVRDVLGDSVFDIRADKVVLAVGPWTNRMLRKDDREARKRVRTTKGVHILYEGKFSDHALLLPSGRDGRIFFAIPWEDRTLIGTTDTRFIMDPDSVSVSDKDIEYLVENTKRVFPGLNFSRDKIITSFAGLRPLVRRRGSPSKVTRTHSIVKTRSGLTIVIGGKYTTYRKIAQDTLWKTFKRKSCGRFGVYGGGRIDGDATDIANKYNIETDTIIYLMDKYGARYTDILKIVEKDSSLAEKLCDCSPAIMAQLNYSAQNEMAVTADDIITRRLSLQFIPCNANRCRHAIFKFFQSRT
ncbi:MAG: glycerol-3-phosphate dehydrogenase/oxidase [Candidatus Omnitrophota bacterium]